MILRILIIFILFLSSYISINAQRASQVAWISKFAVAGGVTPLWIVPDFGKINNQIKGFGLEEFSSSGLVAWGGSGYAYIKVVDNVRLGGIGFSGSVNREAVVNGFNREAVYSLGGGGLTIEYSLPMIRKVALSVGAIIGAGSLEIELYQNNQSFTWDGIWQGFDNPTENYSRILKNSFFTITPTINLDIPFNRLMAFRLGGGYFFTINNDWEVENGREVLGVPSGIKGDSFFIQTGLFLGLFLF